MQYDIGMDDRMFPVTKSYLSSGNAAVAVRKRRRQSASGSTI